MATKYVKAIDCADKISEVFGIPLHDLIDVFAEIPSADVAEVKHGEWVDRDDKTWCSLCNASNKQYKPPYCPHCGAKMDGGK